MNLRIVIAAGIVSALVGAMLGIVASAMVEHSRVGQRTPNRRRNAIAGASVGFVIGAGFAALKQEGDDYFGEEEEGENQG
ncbi:MAG: hypothetical protein AB4040_19825 [Synechococcus sp.]